jgi:hypothetical protein
MLDTMNVQSPPCNARGTQDAPPPPPSAPPGSGQWWSDPRLRIALGACSIISLALVGLLLWRAVAFLRGAGPVSEIFDSGWQFLAILGALIVFAIVLYTLIDAVAPGAYSASLLVTAVSLPVAAATGTVVAYLARMQPEQAWNRWINDLAVLVGLLVAFFLWPLFAALYRPFATVDRANARV